MNGVVVVDGTEIAAFVHDMYRTRSTPKRQQVEQIVEDFLVWRFKKNGPASAPTLPDRGSNNPSQDIQNMDRNTTAAGARQDDFPLAFPGQTASADLATGRRLLSAALDLMEGGEDLASSEVQCVFSVVFAATSKLDVIQLFLDDLECPDQEKQYQAARRLWTRQNAGKAVAA